MNVQVRAFEEVLAAMGAEADAAVTSSVVVAGAAPTVSIPFVKTSGMVAAAGMEIAFAASTEMFIVADTDCAGATPSIDPALAT